jgi:hypothetical protein
VTHRHILVESNLNLNIAQILSGFRISKVVEKGQKVEPVINFFPGIDSNPASFKTAIMMRSPEYEAILSSVEKIHP